MYRRVIDRNEEGTLQIFQFSDVHFMYSGDRVTSTLVFDIISPKCQYAVEFNSVGAADSLVCKMFSTGEIDLLENDDCVVDRYFL